MKVETVIRTKRVPYMQYYAKIIKFKTMNICIKISKIIFQAVIMSLTYVQ